MKNLHKFILVIVAMLICIGNPTSVQADRVDELITVLSEGIPKARYEAVIELGKIADPRAAQPLVKALIADRSFGRQGTIRTENIEKALIKIGGASVEPLVHELKDRKHGPFIRAKIAKLLGDVGNKQAVESLVAALKDEEKYVRAGALYSLQIIKDERAVEPLIELLKNDDEENYNRYLAITALGTLNSSVAVKPLINIMNKDKYKSIRQAAMDALGDIKDPCAVNALVIEATKDKESEFRERARKLLLTLKNPQAVDAYIAILDTDNMQMRFDSASILIKLNSPKAMAVRKKVSAIISEGLDVVEETICNVYGQPATKILKNRQGVQVAKLKTSYDGSYILHETLFDLSNNKQIQICTYDQYGKREQPKMFLCLDQNGDIIRDKKGNPVLVKVFTARQKSVKRTRFSEYNSTIVAGVTATIYPCENCAEETGLKNCRYVW